MKLIIKRTFYLKDSIIGRVHLEDNQGRIIFECYSLELPFFDNNHNISSIPIGKYQCIKHVSEKYSFSWEVLNVPDRSGILIHVANKPKDIHGCIGLGKEALLQYNFSSGFISDSQITIKNLAILVKDSFELIIID